MKSVLRRMRARFLRRRGDLEWLLNEQFGATPVDNPKIAFASPAVTVVIPTWNRAAALCDAIASVQAQRFSDWELIIVDDGSTDDTAKTVATFSNSDSRIRYVTQQNAGPSVARNHALRLAKGALIAYLDSDNVWYPEFLGTAVAIFAARPEVDCAYGAMIAQLPRGRGRVLFEPFDRDRLIAGNFIDMSALIHRRGLVERYGGFDNQTVPYEDWDLVLRYTEHAPACRLPALAVLKRVVDLNLSSRISGSDSFATVRAKWADARNG
jgi:glycosyltransferase involved in cell wall biosynthesis